MEYKRLTEKDEEGNWTIWEDDYSHPFEALQVAIERLAELEDKIEQGTLKEFNDNLIGETVFGIQQDTTGKFHFEGASNTLIGFTSNGIVTWNDVYSYNDYFMDGFWFFTSEEAEKRLKELQE
jgi:hypothetical protein